MKPGGDPCRQHRRLRPRSGCGPGRMADRRSWHSSARPWSPWLRSPTAAGKRTASESERNPSSPTHPRIRRDIDMRIAVITDDGQTISQHFGRALHYLVVTIEEGKITQRELRDKVGHQHFAGEGTRARGARSGPRSRPGGRQPARSDGAVDRGLRGRTVRRHGLGRLPEHALARHPAGGHRPDVDRRGSPGLRRRARSSTTSICCTRAAGRSMPSRTGVPPGFAARTVLRPYEHNWRFIGLRGHGMPCPCRFSGGTVIL